jgi:Flp pilus assembly protein TadD
MIRSGRCLALALLLCCAAKAQQVTPPPASVDTSLEEARSLVRTGQLSQAEAALSRYVEQHPSSAEANFLLGYVLFREQKPRESLAAYTAGAQWQRPSADDLRVVASDYILLNDFADADKWFTEVTAQKPGDAEGWYLLGRTKYNENRFEEAITSFERVLALRPQDVAAVDNLGLAYEGLGRTQEAKAAFQRAIDWQGAHPMDGQPYLNLGDLLTTQGDLDGAVRALTQAANLAPENAKVREQLGRAYEVRGDLVSAQRELEQAVRLAPNASSLHFKLGQVYHRRGLAKQAEAEFAICSRLNGSHSSTEVPNPFRVPPQTNP